MARRGFPKKPAPVRWQCLGARASGAPAGGDARTPARWSCLLKGRVLRSNARCAAFPRLLPLIPPTPFSHKGRRGRLGVLMPETEDGAQGLPQKTCPCKVAMPGSARLRRVCGRGGPHTRLRLRRACGRGRPHTRLRLRRAERRESPCIQGFRSTDRQSML
jgi:hypothetical protein